MLKRSPAVYITLLCLLSSCSQEVATSTPAPQFQTVTNLHDLMTWVIDPAAEAIWDSAGTIITQDSRTELAPTTDAGWAEVKHNAMIIAVAGNLLLMPDKTKNNNHWVEIAQGLSAIGLQAANAADAQDADELFEVGGRLYNVCVACHQRYLIDQNQEQ